MTVFKHHNQLSHFPKYDRALFLAGRTVTDCLNAQAVSFSALLDSGHGGGECKKEKAEMLYVDGSEEMSGLLRWGVMLGV